MLALGLAAVFTGCQPKAPAPAPADELAAARALATTHTSEIHAALDPARPGHGTTDYPGHAEGHVPKSYAMVLLAEVERQGSGWRSGQANLARAAGEWLLTHADENGDGVVGWGLPVAWDAYDDGSVNPANTEYTISTAIVIDALLGWAERDPEAPLARIRRTVQAAIEPYLEPARWSPSGLAPYSLSAADRRYDTFNPAAYLAGQIQRASLGVADPQRRARYLASADATMRAVLRHRQLAPVSGHWYWSYSVQQPTLPNDLPHAGYMIDGIRAYIEHGGRLADEFDWVAVLAHLGDFRGTEKDPEAVRAFPGFRPRIALPARAYDLGFALHLACTESRMAHLAPWLVKAVGRYRTEAARYLKYPVGTPAGLATAPGLVVNEYEAYLYRGLTACALAPGVPASGAAASGVGAGANSVAPAAASAGPAASAVAAEVGTVASRPSSSSPLRQHAVRMAGPAAAARSVVPLLPAAAGLVSFDARERARVLLPAREGGATDAIALDVPGVPVRVLAEGGATHLFVRRHPDDRLLLLRHEGGRVTCRLSVEHGDDPTAVASLRAAALHGGRLHAVIYHNPSQANWYLAWDLDGPCPRPAGPAQRLPSLGEPAGATYEMVPGLHFHAGPAATGTPPLWLAGGNVQMEVSGKGLHNVELVEGCRHIVESTPTPLGLAHLCVAAAAAPVPAGAEPGQAAVARAPVIVAPATLRVPAIDTTRGVPWRLRYSLGALHIDHAASPRQLRHLLRSDLARTAPGGWAEVGINNEEGRIPWSQVYCLNGYLDLLDVAGRDARVLALYGPMLAEVRQRLDLEMRLLDRQVASGGHHTRAFTVDRSRALFGVQTARMLLVLHRYRSEVAGALPMASLEPLRRAVQQLAVHIEVLATAGEEARWLRPGRHHLRWPLGSKFAFDGMAVPFNHQNEWAYGVLATAGTDTPAPVLQAATDVIGHFVERVAPAGRLPASGSWDYWWGQAFDGWRPEDGRSTNMPGYRGDRIKAWISFRTIDAMSLLAGAPRLGEAASGEAQRSAGDLARRGLLYPLAYHALADRQAFLMLAPAVAQEYARTSAPWELGNSAWSLATLAAHWRPPVPAPASR
ncbi:MAG: hypothetical protein JNJ89_17065 [Rubrivivax sp.]|nr:hypothetical protein [Rubrivivax sp.]